VKLYIFQNLKKNNVYEVANIIKVIVIILNMQNMYDLDTYNSKNYCFLRLANPYFTAKTLMKLMLILYLYL